MKKYKYRTKYSRISDEKLLKILREAASLLGGFVTRKTLKKLDNFPGVCLYDKRFGTWGRALLLAGLPMKPSWPTGKPRNNEKTPLRLRYKILERDNFTCQYCGRTPQDGAKLVVDHKIPLSKNGKATFDNLITSCSKCNAGKGDIILGQKKRDSTNDTGTCVTP